LKVDIRELLVPTMWADKVFPTEHSV
jgi:hypothetical protein